MSVSKLYIFVEGSDDEMFFKHVVIPLIEKKYQEIRIIPSSGICVNKKNNYIESIISMGAEYWYVVDINNAPCVSKKKENICKNLRNIDIKKIIVVKKEIDWLSINSRFSLND